MRHAVRAGIALPIVDVQIESQILAYHTGIEQDADPASRIAPSIGAREVQDELCTDLWTALQEGVI